MPTYAFIHRTERCPAACAAAQRMAAKAGTCPNPSCNTPRHHQAAFCSLLPTSASISWRISCRRSTVTGLPIPTSPAPPADPAALPVSARAAGGPAALPLCGPCVRESACVRERDGGEGRERERERDRERKRERKKEKKKKRKKERRKKKERKILLLTRNTDKQTRRTSKKGKKSERRKT